MDAQKFVKDFADQFEETNPDEIRLDTAFRSLQEWSSMMALVIIAMMDEKYGVTLTGEEIRASETVEDLFKAVVSKVKK
ncbi:MAG: acyl carrier protein [Cyclobacteriaceae bacterium]|nr:acyl carrier protein [Cyclobacteriaceae bacterium]